MLGLSLIHILILRKIAGQFEERLKVLKGNLKKQGYISEVKSVISEFTQYGVGFEAVSYTHLDVYKRQGQCHDIFGQYLFCTGSIENRGGYDGRKIKILWI